MFNLESLPYSMDALLPYMSAETLEFHHGKHHQAYINFVNDFVAKESSLENKTLEEIILLSSKKPEWKGLFNNASQIYNHNEFWKMMAKPDSISMSNTLRQRIEDDFGSVSTFRDNFIQSGKTLFGSGWVFVVVGASGKLEIKQYPNGNNPIPDGLAEILGIDVWEHSYYLDYQNRRPDYLASFFDHLVNWEYVELKLTKELEK